MARLNVKLNLWSNRHIVIAVTRVHVKSIASYFAKDNNAWKEMIQNNPGIQLYAWQAGHQRATNNDVYGLEGLDFDETFAPVVSIEAIWIIFAIHIDCKIAKAT
jgi:hypothetical protein